MLAVVGPTAGRYYIDITSGVPPKQFIRGEWLVAIAALIAFARGFTVRMIALYRSWEEPLAKEPAGVYMHNDGRPLLGRKLAGKSQRELHDLGLVVENWQPAQAQPTHVREEAPS